MDQTINADKFHTFWTFRELMASGKSIVRLSFSWENEKISFDIANEVDWQHSKRWKSVAEILGGGGGGLHDLRMDGGLPPGFQKATLF